MMGLAFPMLVDTIDDRAGNLYSGMPGRLYVIDREGKIAFKSGRGPYLFKPAELEQALVLLLQEKPATGNQADASTKAAVRTRHQAANRRRSARHLSGGDSRPSPTKAPDIKETGPWHTSSCPKACPASSGR